MTYQPLIPRVAEAFGIDYRGVGSSQKGYRNESYGLSLPSGESINVIFHKSESDALLRIKSADKASSFLKDYYPIRTRFDMRTLTVASGEKKIYAGLYTYLPGSTIPWEAYTKDHIKLLGWAMSDMHAVWNEHGADLNIRITDELTALLVRMERYFTSPDVYGAMQEKLEVSATVDSNSFHSLFKRLDDDSAAIQHMLHMDLVRGNVLFGEDGQSPWRIDDLAITGVIDFEKAATGHPVFDIARTLAFLLVDCAAKDRRSIFKYFLHSGYNKRGKSSFRQKDSIAGLPAGRVLNELIGFFLLHDFYKFLRHTPYESLDSNHHFIRTRDILIDYGMIRLNKD